MLTWVSSCPGRSFIKAFLKSAVIAIISSLANKPTTSPVISTELINSKNISSFITNQFFTIIRAFSNYQALRVFISIGLIIITPGIFGFARFLYLYFAEGGEGHIQSLIFSTVLITIGFTVLMSGVIADLISNNRKLIENVSYLIKKDLYDKNKN